MRIAVTGATGFIGRHLVPSLLDRNHSVLAVAQCEQKLSSFGWSSQTELLACNVYKCDETVLQRIADQDAVIHLVWPGLPNYNEMFHIEKNYPSDYIFLKSLIGLGLKQLLVTGTCFEYGMKNGCLDENMTAEPTTPYESRKISCDGRWRPYHKNTSFGFNGRDYSTCMATGKIAEVNGNAC